MPPPPPLCSWLRGICARARVLASGAPAKSRRTRRDGDRGRAPGTVQGGRNGGGGHSQSSIACMTGSEGRGGERGRLAPFSGPDSAHDAAPDTQSSHTVRRVLCL
eukprot:364964-Chlamydomonas_euryale.AAC.22